MKNKLDESKWVGFIIVYDELFPREIQKKFDFFEFWIFYVLTDSESGKIFFYSIFIYQVFRHAAVK